MSVGNPSITRPSARAARELSSQTSGVVVDLGEVSPAERRVDHEIRQALSGIPDDDPWTHLHEPRPPPPVFRHLSFCIYGFACTTAYTRNHLTDTCCLLIHFPAAPTLLPCLANSTTPAARAYSVSSRPRPTWSPATKRVPRCRTRISPAFTFWPPKRFTPRRWPGLVRPFFEDPPAFLVAVRTCTGAAGRRRSCVRLRSMALFDWGRCRELCLLMPALADWAAGSARRREQLPANGCAAVVDMSACLFYCELRKRLGLASPAC